MTGSLGFGNYLESDGFGVRAQCREGRGIGWYLTAGGGRDARFTSDPIEYAAPVGVVAVYRYAPHELPAVLAKVGIPGTGQPYELFTFRGRKIVPVPVMANGVGLGGGGAAFHGQGLFCSHRDNKLVLTELDWDGPNPNAPSHRVKGGGITFDGGDKVTAHYERWTFSGRPLVQRSVVALPSKTLTYRRANALDNAHCG